jgi:hypothetical protein
VLIEGALSPDEIGRLDGAVDRVRGAEREDEDGPLHLLAFCGRDGAFLELLDHPERMPLIAHTLGSNVFMYHCHLDVHPPETPFPLITPVRAQLLGNGGSSIDFWKPDRLELPVRAVFER